MGYISAREQFEMAGATSEDQAVKGLAEGLDRLSRAIQNDLVKLDREIKEVKAMCNRLR
jgi:hypothetical protein